MRPVERVFVGDPEVSEAIYRLRQGGARRPPPAGGSAGRGPARRAGALAAAARAPARRGRRDARTTVWTVADVTRDRDRQENVFQDLQHAIDYLDHAPAGFFSVDASGAHRLPQRDARRLARPRSRAGRLGRAEAHRHRAGRQRGAARPRSSAEPGDVKTEVLDLDLKTRGGKTAAGAALSQGRVRAPTARPAPRARSCSTARATTAPTRSAPPKCASCASSTTRRWRSRRSTRPAASRAPTRSPRRMFQRVLKGEAAGPLDPQRRRSAATAPRSKPRSREAARGQGDIAPIDAALAGERRERRWARFYVTPVEDAEQRPRGRDRLRARHHRAAQPAEPVRPGAEDGVGRPARRRHRARLQQRALRHHDGDRLPARPRTGRPIRPSRTSCRSSRTPTARPRLVRQLLAFSRRQTLRPQVLDLGEALSDFTMLLRAPDRREGDARRRRMGAICGRSRPTSPSSSR